MKIVARDNPAIAARTHLARCKPEVNVRHDNARSLFSMYTETADEAEEESPRKFLAGLRVVSCYIS